VLIQITCQVSKLTMEYVIFSCTQGKVGGRDRYIICFLFVDFSSFHSRVDNVINDFFNYIVTRHRWNLVARLFMFVLIFNERVQLFLIKTLTKVFNSRFLINFYNINHINLFSAKKSSEAVASMEATQLKKYILHH
jgi:hypothetical protein